MNAGLLKRLALETGGAHFPEVFKQHQEDYTKKVLMECYQLFLNSDQREDHYLAIDLLFDIQKHFDITFAVKQHFQVRSCIYRDMSKHNTKPFSQSPEYRTINAGWDHMFGVCLQFSNIIRIYTNPNPSKRFGFFVVVFLQHRLTKVALPTIIDSVELIEKEKNR